MEVGKRGEKGDILSIIKRKLTYRCPKNVEQSSVLRHLLARAVQKLANLGCPLSSEEKLLFVLPECDVKWKLKLPLSLVCASS